MPEVDSPNENAGAGPADEESIEPVAKKAKVASPEKVKKKKKKKKKAKAKKGSGERKGDSEKEWKVRAVLGMRKRVTRPLIGDSVTIVEYEVEWVGYTGSSWEPAANMNKQGII